MIQCCICGKKVENDNVQGLKYKRKNYCYECFCNEFNPVEVDKHFAYLKFQDIFNRVPTSAEWTQMTKLVNEHKWEWNKIELILEYVYLIERREIDEEYGAIGILPFYEAKARKFYDTLDEVYNTLDNVEEPQKVTVYATNYTHKKPVELKSIDELVNWEEEDDEDWQE